MESSASLTEPNERHREIRRYLEDTFLFEFGTDAGEHENLFEAGLLDSFGLVGFISFLESTYGIQFTEEEMTSPELTSYSGIVTLVDSKVSG